MMSDMTPRRYLALGLGGACLVVAACSGSDEPQTVLTPPSFTLPATSTTAPATTIVAPATVPEATVDVTAPPTIPPPDPGATTTTEPVAVQELILRGDGIGSARFGASPQGVIEYITSILGGNTGDTGWVNPFSFADCGAGGAATRARRVDWGVLSLLFSDASTYALERDHFIGYEYGRVGQIGDDPVGLRTTGNTALGSRVVDLYAEFFDVSVNAGDESVGIPPNFYVSDVFYGLLTGTSDADVVTVVFGGYGCGE
jgi:hypothetical protein